MFIAIFLAYHNSFRTFIFVYRTLFFFTEMDTDAHVLEDLLPSLLRASHQHPTQPLSILDVGCGSGYLGGAVAGSFPN